MASDTRIHREDMAKRSELFMPARQLLNQFVP